MKELPVIGLLISGLIFSYIYFETNMPLVHREVIRYTSQYFFIVWLLIDRAKNIKYGLKSEVRLRKALIYSVCVLYSLNIFINLYYIGVKDYMRFRTLVTNRDLITAGWALIYIYLIATINIKLWMKS